MPTNSLKERLEALHRQWHDPRYLGTDPLVLVAEARPEDREVVAFLASCLALGRASLVVRAGHELLTRIGPSITEQLKVADPGTWAARVDGFRYRFFSAPRISGLLDALGGVLRRHGTLEAAWVSTGASRWEALDAFSGLLRSPGTDLGVLVPVAGSAGAAKRLNLFLRWMVRHDSIDLGLWRNISPKDLFMPIDTHVLQWARSEGLTRRTTADRKACLEITAAFRDLSPEDPLRYDFAVTRAGMAAKKTLF